MNSKIFTIAAKASVATSLFLASGVGGWLKRFFLWVFDNSCDPDKFGPLTNLF